MKFRMLITAVMLLSLFVLVSSIPAQASLNSSSVSLSLTVTNTTSLSTTSGGSVSVSFEGVDLIQASPQTYSFGVTAKASPGSMITQLIWQFGDGSSMDSPYSGQSQVSEVRNHAYSQPGAYTVSVIAWDNLGNWGYAQVQVNWVTPVPEYTSYGFALLLSMLFVPVLLRRRRMSSP